jgi:serine/threonine-protein kinase RsbW
MTRETAYTTDIAIRSDPVDVSRLQDDIETALRANRFSDKEIFGIRLALEEALINAIKHGNSLDPAKKVHIAYGVGPERFDIRIMDEGPGFDPEDVPNPTAAENLERPCGRGLMLMRHYMSEVEFNERGNIVVMSKLRNGSK